MARFINKNKEDIGLSPYAMVFRGIQKIDKIQINCIEYNETNVIREIPIEDLTELHQLNMTENYVWLNIYGIHDETTMKNISDVLKIPTNIFADILNPSIRPKVQEFDNGVFISLKMLRYKAKSESILVENFSVIITASILITIQEQPGNFFSPIRERLRKHNNKIRKSGTDYLASALLDVVVDNYIYILGIMGEKIEDLEERMTNHPSNDLVHEINNLKCELNLLRKNIKPAKEMILSLAKLESELLRKDNRIHIKKLQDNINEANDLSDSYREILYDQLTIYHTNVSARLNDIMRILTIFSVIFIPLTFIVGIYGTNFDNIPELHWKFGYFIMLAIMSVIAILMIGFFKRKGWF